MSELGIPGSGINPVESEHTGQALPCLSQLTPVFGSQPCPGYCCLFHPCSLENEPGAGFYPRAKPEGWLSPKPSPCCAPAPLSAHRSCLLFIPTVLDSLRNFSPGRGRHLSLNQNLSGSRTEAPTSKPASAFRAALLAACQAPLKFRTETGTEEGASSKKMPLSGRALGTLGVREAAPSLPPGEKKKIPPGMLQSLWTLPTLSARSPALFSLGIPSQLEKAGGAEIAELCYQSALSSPSPKTIPPLALQPGSSAVLRFTRIIKRPFCLETFSLL